MKKSSAYPPTSAGSARGTAQFGFSLIELIVTLSIVGVLMAVATPSFIAMTTRNRIVTYANTVIATMNYARAEAIRRGAPVSVCASSNGTSCTGAWSAGWIIFLNKDNDSPAVVDAGEDLLKVQSALSSSYTLGSATFSTHVTFAANGSAQSSGTFAVCKANTTVGSRAIVINRLRPRIGRDTDANNIPNNDAGTDIASCTP